MAVPRRKTSPSRRGMRRSADALKRPVAQLQLRFACYRQHRIGVNQTRLKGPDALADATDRVKKRRIGLVVGRR